MTIKPGDSEYPELPVVAEYQEPGQYPVWWEFNAETGSHHVSYGAEAFDCMDSLSAAYKFGEYVRHAAECAGKFNEE